MAPDPRAERSGSLPRVGYLGPEGTFSEDALLSSALPDAIEPVSLASIYDTVTALREGAVEWAIVPIENSLDGSVTVTLDLLADDSDDVRVVGEALLAVRHSLIAAADVPLASIDTVLTHPQVPGQCRRLLRGELAGAQVLPTASTAEAVRTVVASGEARWAALGTVLAARIYGGTVLREDVQDRDDNETRFAWLARAGRAASATPPLRDGEEQPWKTSLLFWGDGTGRPGWLVRCLDEFARREINLTKIESRPRPGRLGSYMFFADAGGHEDDEILADALAGLRALCEHVRVLGSYRAAAGR
jgi:prephenate dehydratase